MLDDPRLDDPRYGAVQYQTLDTVENVEDLVGATVHIAEFGKLYCDVVIDKVNSSFIFSDIYSFSRENSTIYLVHMPMANHCVGDVVPVVKINNQQLETPIPGIVKKVEQEQGGGIILHVSIIADTPELHKLKSENSEDTGWGYFSAGFLVERNSKTPGNHPTYITACGYWE